MTLLQDAGSGFCGNRLGASVDTTGQTVEPASFRTFFRKTAAPGEPQLPPWQASTAFGAFQLETRG